MPRIHDLGLLIEKISVSIETPANILDSCDNLTPYGVKARYPQELYLEDIHAQKALEDATNITEWCMKFITE